MRRRKKIINGPAFCFFIRVPLLACLLTTTADDAFILMKADDNDDETGT